MRNEFATLLLLSAVTSCEPKAEAIRPDDPPLAPSLVRPRMAGGALQWRVDVLDATHEQHVYPLGRVGFTLPSFGNWTCEVEGVTDSSRAQIVFESATIRCLNERQEAVFSIATCPLIAESAIHNTVGIVGLGGRETIDLHCDPVR